MFFFIFWFIVFIMTEKASGVCRIDNVRDSQGEIVIGKQYIHCEFENISSDLYTKVKPFYEYYKSDTIEWLEISDTDIHLLSSVSLGPLHVSDLRINNANIHEIEHDAFLDIYRHLAKLSLKNNKLSSIKDYYFKGLFIMYLDLSFNNITSISQNSFLGTRYLHTLILKNNLLSNLPPNLFPSLNHWRLLYLDISFNKLLTLDTKVFAHLWSLIELRLNDNYLTHLDEDIFTENRDLIYLFINNNRFRGFYNLTLPKSMKTVNVSHNSIAFLNFREHTIINTLDLSSNGISSSKNLSFTNATVSQLLLDNNNLESTHHFTYFPSLWHLSITNNKLKQINPNIKTSIKLTRLNLAKNNLCNNDLFNLPTSLNDLLVGFNNLTEITFSTLQGLKFLKILHLEHNQIRKIALGAFRDLGQLTELDLSNNKISVLDIGVFGGLNALKHLNLSHNELQQINSNAFYNLRALRIINLSKTKVKYSVVETILLQLPNIEQVGLAENGWSCSRIINITNQFGKKVIDMGEYNSTNVDGVACNYAETPEQKPTNLSRFEAGYHGLFKFQICLIC